ncbi:MAG: hypothetical protein NTV56_24070 [Alphaproteobacteria bacterium]|nr:hypothetical protein [Alphaproteobacteria bacterium]
MDPRILIAAVVCLVTMAFGGFYFALAPGAGNVPLRPSQAAAPPSAGIPPSVAASSEEALLLPPASPPPMATPASVEAEIALSEYADLLTFVKKNFSSDYNELLVAAVRRRNEGASDHVFGQELGERFQNIMRGKLKYGVGASLPTIDKLAANEASLFHALGTEGASFCLKMLGKDDAPATGAPPESVLQLMKLGTMYRFQAIAEGMSNTKPLAPLTVEEGKAFEASLARDGLNSKDVNSGAYLKAGLEPGKPCLLLETLHLAIARLQEGARRKIYAGMFFLGRDR